MRAWVTPRLEIYVNGAHLPLVAQLDISPRLVSLWDASARYLWRVVLTFFDTPDGQPPPRTYWAEQHRIDEATWTVQITGAIPEPPPMVYMTPAG